jgi:M6 family metalloprotease-like protein
MLRQGRCARWILCLVGLVLIGANGLSALEPPSKLDLLKARLDGTLAEKLAFAKSLGNHLVEPGLAAEFENRLAHLRLKSLGRTDDEIDRILPALPSGNRPGLKSRGTSKIFALLIDFPDYPSTNSSTAINNKLFGDGDTGYPRESLRNYYRRSSYNLLEIQGATLGWYRPATSRSSVTQTYVGRENLIKEALNSIHSAGHNFAQYDNDGDGDIDYFVVIWTGPPGAWASFWWGYYTSWSSSFILDGKQFQGANYSWQWEANPVGGTFSPYVVIHETGHSLGLPDLYDYDGSVGPNGGVGGADMMDANNYDHNGFSKMLLDWLTPQVVSAGNRTVALTPTGSTPSAMIFWPNYNLASPFTEFFLVQNRYRINNDTGGAADGLLVWHIDATLNASNVFAYDNSYTDHKLVRLMEADGLEEIEQNKAINAGDYYVAGKVFSPTSTPNSKAYSGASTNAYLDSISISGTDMSCNIAYGGKTLTLAVNNASLGTTSPAPGQYTYSLGADVRIQANPATFCAFLGWTGDLSGAVNPVNVAMDRDKSITAYFQRVNPPSSFSAERLANRSALLSESIIDFSWAPNPANSGLTIAAYRLYELVGGSWVKLGEDIGPNAQSYRLRMAPKSQQSFGITSVSSGGVESPRSEIVK